MTGRRYPALACAVLFAGLFYLSFQTVQSFEDGGVRPKTEVSRGEPASNDKDNLASGHGCECLTGWDMVVLTWCFTGAMAMFYGSLRLHGWWEWRRRRKESRESYENQIARIDSDIFSSERPSAGTGRRPTDEW